MFIAIVVIAVVTGILFLILLVSLALFIYNSIKKDDAGKKKNLRVVIPAAAAWVLLISLNIVLAFMFLSENKDEIIDKSVRIPAELAGKGLALTFQSFEKNWDQNRILQLQNLHISPSFMNYEQKDGMKIYDIELIFDNNSPADIKLYLDDLIGNHYLAACDSGDFVYLLELSDRLTSSVKTEQMTEQTVDGKTERATRTSTQYANTIIPFGKSRFRFALTAPEDVEITHLRFVDKTIPLK